MECMQVEEKCFQEFVLKSILPFFFIEKQNKRTHFIDNDNKNKWLQYSCITVRVVMVCVREREFAVCEFMSSFIPCGIFCGVILWP